MKQQIFTKLAALLLFFSLFSNAFAQGADSTKPNILADTQWTGIVNAPSPEQMTFSFSEKVLDLLYEGQSIETMNYTVDRNIITLTKLSGGSPCTVNSTGSYTFTNKDNNLTFSLVNDECDARIAAFDPQGYTLVEKK